jgi:hypothetical protein
VFNGVDVLVNARLSGSLFVNGGVSAGDVHSNECGARIDSPSARVVGTGIDTFCDTHTGYLTQVKASGAYTVPWQQIQIGAVLQNLPGQAILAAWPIVGTQTTLGRAFASGGSLQVNLIEPGTQYTPRRTQLDIRLSKSMRFGTRRLQLMADIYNLFNSSATVGATSQSGEPPAALNQTYGADWLRPFNILQARYAKFGASLNF